MKRFSLPDSSVEYSIDLILSYSPSFNSGLTEDDKLFEVRCRYSSAVFPMEGKSGESPTTSNRRLSLGTAMEIRLFPRTVLQGSKNVCLHPSSAPLSKSVEPRCTYTLHLHSPTGPLAASAHLRERVFHKWQCNSLGDIFRLHKVYSCFVHGGINPTSELSANSTNQHVLVDEKGCSADARIMATPMRVEGGVGEGAEEFLYATSNVFRLLNETRMHFNCLLFVCQRGDEECAKEAQTPTCSQVTNHTPSSANGTRVSRSVRLRDPVGASVEQSVDMLETTPLPFNLPADIALTQSVNSTTPEDTLLPLSESDSPDTNFLQHSSSLIIDQDDQLQRTQSSVVSSDIDSDGELLKACEQRRIAEAKQLVQTKKILTSMIICNLVSLSVATTALVAMCRRRFEARLSITHEGTSDVYS